MSVMSVGSNVQVLPATKACVKKNWTRNEVRNAAITTTAVAAGAGFLSKGKGLLGLVAWVSGLMSLGLWYNHHNMKKNNVDALQYTA